jgi:hypothetical protein
MTKTESMPSTRGQAIATQGVRASIGELRRILQFAKESRLVRANTASPYYAGLAETLTRAFGVPAVLANVLVTVDGIDAAYIG